MGAVSVTLTPGEVIQLMSLRSSLPEAQREALEQKLAEITQHAVEANPGAREEIARKVREDILNAPINWTRRRP